VLTKAAPPNDWNWSSLTARIKNIEPRVRMVLSTLKVSLTTAVCTHRFNPYDCRCESREEPQRVMLRPRDLEPCLAHVLLISAHGREGRTVSRGHVSRTWACGSRLILGRTGQGTHSRASWLQRS
jgi:hypothetical protein